MVDNELLHWLVLSMPAIIVFGLLWPLSKLLARMGFPAWWCVLALVPGINILGLWMLAVREWPAFRRGE